MLQHRESLIHAEYNRDGFKTCHTQCLQSWCRICDARQKPVRLQGFRGPFLSAPEIRFHNSSPEYIRGLKLTYKSRSQRNNGKVLTPEEFVQSGDYLVRTCPTWSWEAGDKSKAKPYLPKDKQYLVTRNVPSNRRASALTEYGEKMEDGLKDEGDGWFSTASDHAGGEQAEDIPSLNDPKRKPGNCLGEAEEDDDDDIPDIDDLALDEPEDDEAAVPGRAAEDEDHIIHTRTYDLLISYDKYYQVPRFWLIGYDESRQALSPKQIMEDVSEEHARKTITVDPFPHSSVLAASIHPCKHASVVKKLGQMAEAGGKEFKVENYLILFLKFIASVVPSIEYDYTMAAGW